MGTNIFCQNCTYLLGWVQEWCQAPKLITGHPLAKIYTSQKVKRKFGIHRYDLLISPASWWALRPKKLYLWMSNLDLTFWKVYFYAKGWPVIDLGAWYQSWAHSSENMRALLVLKVIPFFSNVERNLWITTLFIRMIGMYLCIRFHYLSIVSILGKPKLSPTNLEKIRCINECIGWMWRQKIIGGWNCRPRPHTYTERPLNLIKKMRLSAINRLTHHSVWEALIQITSSNLALFSLRIRIGVHV